MNWKISFITLSVLLVACSEATTSDLPVAQASYLIEAEELQSMMDRPHIKLVDFRKAFDYAQEHLTGAVNIWRDDIEDPTYDYKGMMAGKEQLESLLGGLGVSSNDTLVIYDNDDLCNAARLWWVLQNYDFDQVKLLHGGIAGWKSSGRQVTRETPETNKATFTLTDAPSMKWSLAKEEMHNALATESIILDTRTADEFSGKRQKEGAAKAGRIPGSVHIDWAEAVAYEKGKRMKSMAELEKIYGQSGMTKDTPVIVYCHTGVRSAHTTFVLTQLLGYTNVRNYDGSWTEWSHFDDLPMEKDSTTTIH